MEQSNHHCSWSSKQLGKLQQVSLDSAWPNIGVKSTAQSPPKPQLANFSNDKQQLWCHLANFGADYVMLHHFLSWLETTPLVLRASEVRRSVYIIPSSFGLRNYVNTSLGFYSPKNLWLGGTNLIWMVVECWGRFWYWTMHNDKRQKFSSCFFVLRY